LNKDFKENLKIVFRILVAVALFVAVLFNYDKLVNLDVRAFVGQFGNLYFATGAVLAVYILKSITFVIPAIMIYLSVGMMFDMKTALLVNLAGIILEVVITYFLGRFLGGEQVNNLLVKNKAGKKLLDLYESKNRGVFLFLVRVLPVFPIDFTSLFLGASRFSFLPYVAVSVIGIMPRVALFTILGETAYRLFPKELLMKLVLILLPIAIVAYPVYIIIKKMKQKNK